MFYVLLVPVRPDGAAVQTNGPFGCGVNADALRFRSERVVVSG
jgi:hypothetical protein